MSAKHTPGPYSLHDQGEDAFMTRYSLQRDGNVALLFEPHVGLNARDVERIFNTQAELLAALRNVEIDLTLAAGIAVGYDLGHALTVVRAALAKAESSHA